jgi:thymidylate synthase
MELHLDDLRNDYSRLVRLVRDKGSYAAPRGLPTRELLNVTLVFFDTSRLIPVGIGRGVSTTLNAYSAAALVAGAHLPEMALAIAPGIASFDADGVDRERYGPRIVAQVEGAVRHLVDDPDTREAIVMLQPPRTREADGGRDFPCTTSIQFLLRDGLLHMTVAMRSNDVWHGLSGDAWMFGQLQETLAWVLGAEVGAYVHHAASLHLYDRDLAKVDDLHPADGNGLAVARGFGDPAVPPYPAVRRLAIARLWAEVALGLARPAEGTAVPPSVTWYMNKLRPFWSAE